ncbi:hypothetical protein QQS21_011739 [Conoideocrella luteorostrata]|uniref:Transcriptional regulatory protein RXT2 N-terminal domain-containing protein n=1 Tax=Conoideocrella luteorostrata TaxID=1105319 RepID=A0AAJ0CCK9_9HYPO|nr:hypothetical protein QQS21_011739 [Conoideocrella luteorostrata]
MATQQILFAETIAGMKKAFKRKAYGETPFRLLLLARDDPTLTKARSIESDSDSDIDSLTNRGHKLQKRARFALKGQLVPTANPSAYKQVVDYAGVRRNILYPNLPLVDDEGYEIISDDDDDRVEEAELAAAELNPYSKIRLEHVLAPLTASTDLPGHPTLSKPFTSKTLTELIAQSCDIMRKENQSLWQVRNLWTSLCGDGVWMPCEAMIGPNDIDLYSEEHLARFLQGLSSNDDQGSLALVVNGNSDPLSAKISSNEHPVLPDSATIDGDVSMADVTNSKDDKKYNGKDIANEQESEAEQAKDGEPNQPQSGEKVGADEADESAQQNGNPVAPAADTRAEQSTVPGASTLQDQSLIYPLFLPPAGAKPNRDLNIPENEAEDIRRLLALYVQKQEEVCRGASRLHQGLLRAHRLRSNVLRWAKAEAHCGPNRDLSDGEDWYDKEEWGLTEDLKKGQDEDEEDTTTTGKKTRARRN